MFHFIEMFEQISMQATSEYLHKKGVKDKEYRELIQIEKNLFHVMMKELDQADCCANMRKPTTPLRIFIKKIHFKSKAGKPGKVYFLKNRKRPLPNIPKAAKR